MLLTKSQLNRFWREWSAVVRHHNWRETWTNLEIDTERKALLKRAGFDSLTHVDRSAGFDRVLAELGRMRDQVLPTAEIDNPEPGDRRRILWLLREHAKPLGGEPYICAIARDRFRITAGLATIEQLDTEQLHQLMITLNARSRAAEQRAELRKADAMAEAEADCEDSTDAWFEQEALKESDAFERVEAHSENPF